ncbi:hypothetical protein QBC47DRAFT_299815 [Echria macrotheca]|uniref:Uncharacterized protein n=1 Tax=Echria macrotheca TaxID=438768 RepID=A0AAJ0BDC0_9PEZI|nr:hypothetical protein QBC47DRAFT_299815 [Echria macrotheca]
MSLELGDTTFKRRQVSDDVDSQEQEVNDALLTKAKERCRAVAPIALEVLQALASEPAWKKNHDDSRLLLTLIPLTDPDLVTELALPDDTAERVSSVVGKLFSSDTSKDDFIVNVILRKYLRTVFLTRKSVSSRLAAYPDPMAGRGEGIPGDDASAKPWKFTDVRAIPFLAWAVREADKTTVEKNWRLILPALLTLVDDNSTPFRRRGLVILETFLDKIPSETLESGGLSQVIESAITPTLNFLPSLTPADESVELLGPAFAALRRLASKTTGGDKTKLLDRCMREGVLHGFVHAREHPSIVALLCRQMGAIVAEMGFHAVKHLKDMVPLLVGILTDPFSPAAVLDPAIDALQAVLRTCWPRMSDWGEEILQAVIACWLNHGEDEVGVKEGLVRCVGMLHATLGPDWSGVVKQEPQLAGLFSQIPRME